MNYPFGQIIADKISEIVDLSVRRAPFVVAFAIFLTCIAVVHLASNLKINTDNEDMLSSELAFRQNSIEMDQAFPQLDDTLLIVLEAVDPDLADEKTDELVAALRDQPEIFEEIFAPESDAFFRRNGLLYLELDELDRLYVRLAAAQPFLGTLWQEPNLQGLADITGLMSEASDLEASSLAEAARVFNAMARVIEGADEEGANRLVWSSLLFGREASGDIERRLVSVKPKLNYGSLQPAERATDTIYSTAQALDFSSDNIGIRLTGGAVLQDEELRSVENGMGLAGLISLILVTAVLALGLRSFGMMCALLVTLIIGLIWTAAIAIFWVGEFNLISVAFAVLFVGLSVDFGIHLTLRATEYIDGNDSWLSALREGGRSVGPSLVFCAITTSIAFFSFLPTSYVGLAELGLIAGTGMFVALVSNLTILPALLRLFVRKIPNKNAAIDGVSRERPSATRARLVILATGITVVAAVWVAKDVRFDFDPMNLRDHQAPAMKTLFDLADADEFEPYTAELLLSDISKLPAVRQELEGLEEVERIESIDNLLPEGISEKTVVVEDLALLVGSSFFAPKGKVQIGQPSLVEARQSLMSNLEALYASDVIGRAAKQLGKAIGKVGTNNLAAVNRALFAGLPAQMERLNELLSPSDVTLETLAPHLTDRYLSESGQVRLEIIPSHDLRDAIAIRDFASAVQTVAPDATGGPIIVVEAGNAVLDAFLQALLYSVLGIGIFLLITLRRPLDVFLVFAPVAVASVWVLGVSAFFDLPFNFANVIVLPLLFGLSVDFGLHLVIREREGSDHAIKTTTPRAILLSALTTLGSFGSIMLSGHPGTSSMGLLLTISIVLSILSILLVLPAMMRLAMPRDAD